MWHRTYRHIRSVIFHEGGHGSIDAGHCVNLLRYNDSWVKTSDSKIKTAESWSNYERQPYLIFLEKVIEKKDTIIEKHLNPDQSASANLDKVQKRKNNVFSLSPFQNDSKKARTDEKAGNVLNDKANTHSFIKTCGNKLLSYETAPNDLSLACLQTPSTGESGEKIVFITQFKSARKKSIRNKEYYKKNRQKISNKLKKKRFDQFLQHMRDKYCRPSAIKLNMKSKANTVKRIKKKI